MLCPSPDPRDSGKGHLSRIVPSPPSSSWPGMQHTLQDYCKTCPASNPFSSCLALVLTAGSCVRPGVRLASRSTRARRRLQPLWPTALHVTHGKTWAAPHLHISGNMRLETHSAGAPQAQPRSCVQVKRQSCARRTPARWEIEGLILTMLMVSLLCSWAATPRAYYRVSLDAPGASAVLWSCCTHRYPQLQQDPADRSQSHHDQPPAATPCLSRPHRGDQQATSSCITLTLQKDFLSKEQVA